MISRKQNLNSKCNYKYKAAVVSIHFMLTSFFLAQAEAQTITPDGATSTTVSPIGSDGRLNVDIAPANSEGISHNTYTEFSVPEAGAYLDNRTSNANLIVNEVTSQERSYLTGALEVQGHKAHIVIANPNGITVDGASFINSGGVVLSDGHVSYDSITGHPIISSGLEDITITARGIASDLSTLQMLASKININAPVINHLTNPNANIEINAGDTELILDHKISPSNASNNLVKEKHSQATNKKAIVIDVTPHGSLSASRIKLAATDAGAGVRFAGQGLSSIGEFSINADGKIGIDGGTIQAEKDIKIKAREIEVRNTVDQQGKLESTTGALTLISTEGDISIHGRINGTARNDEDIDSQGAITLDSARNIKFYSESENRIAVAFASANDIFLNARGDIANHTGRLVSNDSIIISSKSLNNILDITNAPQNEVLSVTHKRGKLLWPMLWTKHKRQTLVSANYGQPRLIDQMAIISAKSIVINTDSMKNSGSIFGRDDGAVIINARYVHNIAPIIGSFSYYKKCGMGCSSNGKAELSVIGGSIASNEGIIVNAREQLINEHGKITTKGQMHITAPQVKGIAASLPNFERHPGGLNNAFSGAKANVSYSHTGGTFTSINGSISITSEEPVFLNGGDIESITPPTLSAGRSDTDWQIKGSRPIGLLRGFFK